MRKLALLASLLAAGVVLAGPWDSAFSNIGQVVSTSPTSASLNVQAGSYLKVVCDVAAYIGQGAGSATCTSTSCDKFAGGERAYVRLLPNQDYVAVLSVSGTATCQVFRALGQ